MTLEKVCGQGTCGERDAQHQIVAPDLLENSVKQKCSQGSKICSISKSVPHGWNKVKASRN